MDCALDFSGIPSDLTIRVGARTFPVHKIILIVRSKYFHTLLTGKFKQPTSDIEIKDVDPTVFALVLDNIYGRPVVTRTFEMSMEYIVLVNFFDINCVDIESLIEEIEVPADKFRDFVKYLDVIYPEGLDPNLLAKKITFETDLTFLSDEMITAIKSTPNFMYLLEPIKELALEAERLKSQPMKYYMRERIIIPAHSFSEALLKIRKYDYTRHIGYYENNIIEFNPDFPEAKYILADIRARFSDPTQEFMDAWDRSRKTESLEIFLVNFNVTEMDPQHYGYIREHPMLQE